MSKEIKLALLALVILPVFAAWFLAGRPAGDGGASSSAPGVESVHEPGPAASAANVTSSVAPPAPGLTAFVAFEPPTGSSSIGADGEARARLLFRKHPGFMKGPPIGCDPPFTMDAEGTRHYKKECF